MGFSSKHRGYKCINNVSLKEKDIHETITIGNYNKLTSTSHFWMVSYKRKSTWSSLLVLNNKDLLLYASCTNPYMASNRRLWYDKLTQDLVHFGFVHKKCDHYFFIYSHQGVTLYALVYVDDIIITWSSSTLIHKHINSLRATFSLKIRELLSILEIEIKRVSTCGILLTQTKYIRDLPSQEKMWNENGTSTFILTNFNLLCMT